MISSIVRKKVAAFAPGRIFRLKDLRLLREQQSAAAMALSRMVKNGELKRLSPGKYHKEKLSQFGVVPPTMQELISDLLGSGSELKGYITGPCMFNELGLTRKMPSVIEIGCNVPRRNTRRGGYAVRFRLQKNPITRENIPLLQLLDCLKWINRIPGISADWAYSILKDRMQRLPLMQQRHLVRLSLKYPPRVRALLGSMLTHPELTKKLLESLNPLTQYQLGISDDKIAKVWNIT